ncbi:alpha-mannosidase 2-like isoform X2 [Prorops nasuta]|uniref:alpha-mannosidase 2-like isoform X2 n=1 Tax=Prorops nasuta TaxID=863751 RepID=UPI0034CF8CC7
MYRILRRGSGRICLLAAIALSLLACFYYMSQTQEQVPVPAAQPAVAPIAFAGDAGSFVADLALRHDRSSSKASSTSTVTNCLRLKTRKADIDAQREFSKFDFQPSWMRSREYWDESFETRYAELRKDPKRPALKVILVPHSHTDPGWLKTFEQYFHSSTRSILNNMVAKLQQWPNMTFIWSEVSFLSLWWESAHPTKKMILKRLVKEGRLEITTGGWVMSDEASSHIYAMLDQLIEGHQWLKANLDVTPVSGWAVDPFGHGGTIPFMLKASGATGTVIQRIHYAWKQWFAKKQYGDFIWQQAWDQTGTADMLTHNQPFDIYNIKHSCGPHPHVCLNFDFRKIRGEYTEYSARAVEITPNNVKQMAELLLEQYSRTGSLFTHNVVLMPLGDDFRYDHAIEWDQQYTNYKTLMDYINNRKEEYGNAEIIFGTPKDYFQEIEKRVEKFPTLTGDFFVYSDIFSEGRPAYWSGYYTTRPYMKILDRELEANLRSAEILYSVALNVARRKAIDTKLYETHFEKLVKARRNLGLFQHHDAITGTSKSFVMKDYALKLFESISDTISLQSFAIQSTSSTTTTATTRSVYVLPDSDRDSYEKLAKKIPISLKAKERRKVVLFNPLAQRRQEVISVKVTSYKVRVLDPRGRPVEYQIVPAINSSISISHDSYTVLFMADLGPLAIALYELEETERTPTEALSTIYCSNCQKDPVFTTKPMQFGDIKLENHRMKLLIDGQSGFLKRITKKSSGRTTQCSIRFAAYSSAQFHSGAYLFMPDPNLRDVEKEILEAYTPHQKMHIINGPLTTRLTVEYGKLLTHHLAIYHKEGSALSEAIHLRNVIDFETPPKNRETEMFMRLETDIVNGEPPEFYTDSNGQGMTKRKKIERIGIEGNYFPITTMAYIEDTRQRLTLLANHGQGAASYQPGWLEVMLDRRTLYDDSRGMGEGLLDNRKTLAKHLLLLEETVEVEAELDRKKDEYSMPSLLANQLSNALNYPVNIFVLDWVGGPREELKEKTRSEVKLLTSSLPCDVHLMNLRTNQDDKLLHYPSSKALMIMQRQGYSCSFNNDVAMSHCPFTEGISEEVAFYGLSNISISRTTLTGIEKLEDLKEGLSNVRLKPMEVQTFMVKLSR